MVPEEGVEPTHSCEYGILSSLGASLSGAQTAHSVLYFAVQRRCLLWETARAITALYHVEA